jgi:hypothetical protein
MALEKFTADSYTYFQLRISCPVCVDQGRNTAQSFWVHHNCGGSIYVGDNANFKCRKCNYSDHVKRWSFNCPSHTNANFEMLKASSQALAQAISTAGQMVSETGHRWLIEFLKNMGEF